MRDLSAADTRFFLRYANIAIHENQTVRERWSKSSHIFEINLQTDSDSTSQNAIAIAIAKPERLTMAKNSFFEVLLKSSTEVLKLETSDSISFIEAA